VDARPEVPSVAGVGEFGLITQVTAHLRQGPSVLLGPGDDAAVVAVPDGRVVVTTDVLVEGRHFRRDFSSAGDVGHRAAAQGLADVAAMGAEATALVVGLAVPGSLEAAWVLELAEGMAAECDLVGASIVGGDVVGADTVVVSVTALGDLVGRTPVTRAGARPGDVVAVAGRLGWAAGGLAVLQRGFRMPRALVEAHRRPLPPYAAGPRAALAGAHAMCDVSDGLLADLGHVAEASGVCVDVDPGRLEIAQPLRDAGAALGIDPLAWVLTGGDDHALVACFPLDEQLPEGYAPVGRVLATGEPGEVLVAGAAWTGERGHAHFR